MGRKGIYRRASDKVLNRESILTSGERINPVGQRGRGRDDPHAIDPARLCAGRPLPRAVPTDRYFGEKHATDFAPVFQEQPILV